MSFSSGTLRRRGGFTLVELLVVIAIIGMLVALLLPAVQAARGVARQRQCASQIGELAKAIAAYETSKGNFPGYAQFVPSGNKQWAMIDYSGSKVYATSNSTPITPLSWAAMLLRNIERQDIWDRIVDGNNPTEIRPIEVFVCPDDDEAKTSADLPALTYSANTGAWDLDDSGRFLLPSAKAAVGDTGANGVMFNLAQWQAGGKKGPKTRISGIKDGANMTILLTENIHKTYYPDNPSGPPEFTWLSGIEQQLGVVWVVSPTPQPGNGLDKQEGINRNAADVVVFDPAWPRFARPASAHSGGVNVAFCDTHVDFLPDTIDYVVYQQLLTTNGDKCVDPTDHNNVSSAINAFRSASPLSESDFD